MGNRTKRRFWLDAALGFGFAVARVTASLSSPLHESLGILWLAGLVVHLVWHRGWFRGAMQRLLRGERGPRLGHLILNALLAVSVLLVTATGLTATLFAGRVGGSWSWGHHALAELSIVLIIIHVVWHWRWLVRAGRRVLARTQKTTAPSSASGRRFQPHVGYCLGKEDQAMER